MIHPPFKHYLLACLLLPVWALGQNTAEEHSPKKNIIKLNVSALLLKNISVQYERKIAPRWSVALNVHAIPFGDLPFSSTVADWVKQPEIDFNQFRFGNVGVVPELRYYVGKKGALNGFYMGGMLNYNSYKADVPIRYGAKTGIFSGTAQAITFGVQFGAQWKLSNKLSLDWWILGPSWGFESGDMLFNGNLTPGEQLQLAYAIEVLRNDDFYQYIVDSYTVSPTGATLQTKGAWGGLRGFGLCLGYRF